MPHFENFDQYEATNPKSGKKKVIPIAPHSIQAVDYKPVKGKHSGKPERKVEPPFKDIKVEPVSIRQMEKEYRQAARKEPRSRGNHGKKGLLARIKAFFGGLFGKSGKDKASRKQAGRQRSRNRSKSGGQGRNRQQRGQKGQDQPRQQARKRGNRRSRNRSRSGGQGGGKQGGPKDGRQKTDAQGSQGGSPKKRPRRNRRRKPSGRSGQQQPRKPDSNSN